MNSLLGVSHLVDYISFHIRFYLERYLLDVTCQIKATWSIMAGAIVCVNGYKKHETNFVVQLPEPVMSIVVLAGK